MYEILLSKNFVLKDNYFAIRNETVSYCRNYLENSFSEYKSAISYISKHKTK